MCFWLVPTLQRGNAVVAAPGDQDPASGQGFMTLWFDMAGLRRVRPAPEPIPTSQPAP